jgi:hypothetical protein
MLTDVILPHLRRNDFLDPKPIRDQPVKLDQSVQDCPMGQGRNRLEVIL